MPSFTFDGAGSASSRRVDLVATWTRIALPSGVRRVTLRLDGSGYIQGEPSAGVQGEAVDSDAYPLVGSTDYEIRVNVAPGDLDPPTIGVAAGPDGTATYCHVLAEG